MMGIFDIAIQKALVNWSKCLNLSQNCLQLVLVVKISTIWFFREWQWVTFGSSEKYWVDYSAFDNFLRWMPNLKNLKKDATHCPHVWCLIVLFLNQNDFWSTIPSRANVAGEASILALIFFCNRKHLFNELIWWNHTRCLVRLAILSHKVS